MKLQAQNIDTAGVIARVKRVSHKHLSSGSSTFLPKVHYRNQCSQPQVVDHLQFRSLQMMMKQNDPRMRMTKQRQVNGGAGSPSRGRPVNTLSRICCCLINEASGRLRCGLLLAAYEYSAAGGRDSV
jgi:histone deacetylase complex regulatory component SIN3